jgi:hypothetical protein
MELTTLFLLFRSAREPTQNATFLALIAIEWGTEKCGLSPRAAASPARHAALKARTIRPTAGIASVAP